MVAAVVYYACRNSDTPAPVLLIDFSELLQVNLYTLGACFLKMRQVLVKNEGNGNQDFYVKALDPSIYIDRFC